MNTITFRVGKDMLDTELEVDGPASYVVETAILRCAEISREYNHRAVRGYIDGEELCRVAAWEYEVVPGDS